MHAPATTLGNYRLDAVLGAGTTGTVWRAHRTHPVRQTVAMKRLTHGYPAEPGRMRREAQVLATLDHPHIVRVLEVLDDGRDAAVVMQYAAGGSLAAMLAARGRLSPGEVVAVAVPIAKALESAHRRGIIHCDVKPANILFTSDGEPLLSDFDVAHVAGWEAAVNGISGTLGYLAPEVLDGMAPDARSDVYSLGVVCYEALVGTVPCHDAPPLTSRPDIPPRLAAVVESAISRDPALRPQTAEQFAAALRA